MNLQYAEHPLTSPGEDSKPQQSNCGWCWPRRKGLHTLLVFLPQNSWVLPAVVGDIGQGCAWADGLERFSLVWWCSLSCLKQDLACACFLAALMMSSTEQWLSGAQDISFVQEFQGFTSFLSLVWCSIQTLLAKPFPQLPKVISAHIRQSTEEAELNEWPPAFRLCSQKPAQPVGPKHSGTAMVGCRVQKGTRIPPWSFSLWGTY